MPSSVVLFSYLFLLLMAYSFLGWCGEMVYCSLGQGKLCEKRGFLNGPLCPIYGHGALLVLTALGGSANPLVTFTAGAVLTSAVEYVTSYLMEKLFHMRWWDYSHKRWNLNGRVCLQNSTIFGLACVALCHWANPAVTLRVGALLRRGIGVPLALSLLVLYLADVVLSVRSAIQIGSRLEQLHAIHDELAAKLEALRQEQRLAAEAQRAKLEAAMGAVRQGAAEKPGRSRPSWSPWAASAASSPRGWTPPARRPSRSSTPSTISRTFSSAASCGPSPPSTRPSMARR